MVIAIFPQWQVASIMSSPCFLKPQEGEPPFGLALTAMLFGSLLDSG
ncbi:hypothetical protein [Thalassotalea hakodatensis]|nr:hypothetical protein [Thalassotalea hakodatensis]